MNLSCWITHKSSKFSRYHFISVVSESTEIVKHMSVSFMIEHLIFEWILEFKVRPLQEIDTFPILCRSSHGSSRRRVFPDVMPGLDSIQCVHRMKCRFASKKCLTIKLKADVRHLS